VDNKKNNNNKKKDISEGRKVRKGPADQEQLHNFEALAAEQQNFELRRGRKGQQPSETQAHGDHDNQRPSETQPQERHGDPEPSEAPPAGLVDGDDGESQVQSTVQITRGQKRRAQDLDEGDEEVTAPMPKFPRLEGSAQSSPMPLTQEQLNAMILYQQRQIAARNFQNMEQMVSGGPASN
jgi:hypothetical protein